MTDDELKELQVSRDLCRSLLKGINLEISAKKSELNELLIKWEKLNNEFRYYDRQIAEATKVVKLKSAYNPKPPTSNGISSRMAKELLEALGIPVVSKASEVPSVKEKIEDLTDSVSILEIMIGEEG